MNQKTNTISLLNNIRPNFCTQFQYQLKNILIIFYSVTLVFEVVQLQVYLLSLVLNDSILAVPILKSHILPILNGQAFFIKLLFYFLNKYRLTDSVFPKILHIEGRPSFFCLYISIVTFLGYIFFPSKPCHIFPLSYKI